MTTGSRMDLPSWCCTRYKVSRRLSHCWNSSAQSLTSFTLAFSGFTRYFLAQLVQERRFPARLSRAAHVFLGGHPAYSRLDNLRLRHSELLRKRLQKLYRLRGQAKVRHFYEPSGGSASAASKVSPGTVTEVTFSSPTKRETFPYPLPPDSGDEWTSTRLSVRSISHASWMPASA